MQIRCDSVNLFKIEKEHKTGKIRLHKPAVFPGELADFDYGINCPFYGK
jgi:hypothetical protein